MLINELQSVTSHLKLHCLSGQCLTSEAIVSWLQIVYSINEIDLKIYNNINNWMNL